LIVGENCLGKRTIATRKLSAQRLCELYGLDPEIMLFRIMRRFWGRDERGHPLLALLVALARDPLLRLTAGSVLGLHVGEELDRSRMTDVIRENTGHRFNDSILDKIVRNAASSWTQSGHLAGKSRKLRRAVAPTYWVAAYALVLGYAQGLRGESLFQSFWASVLDTGPDQLLQLAMDAKRAGLLDMKSAGGITQLSFSQLLTDEERRLIHGAS